MLQIRDPLGLLSHSCSQAKRAWEAEGIAMITPVAVEIRTMTTSEL